MCVRGLGGWLVVVVVVGGVCFTWVGLNVCVCDNEGCMVGLVGYCGGGVLN